MRKVFLTAAALLTAVSLSFAAATHSDSSFLAADTAFQNRVKEAMAATCISIANETFAIANHKKRADFCATVLMAPETYKVLFAVTVATDVSVLNLVTQNGTVVLTAGNAAAQAALSTDNSIDSALSAEFNAFLQLP